MFKIKSLNYTPHFVAIGMLLVSILFITLAFNTANKPQSQSQPFTSNKQQVILTIHDYVLRIQDDYSLVLYDTDGRIVHVFKRSFYPHNTNIFDIIDRDNE